jgi:hypothetical protein
MKQTVLLFSVITGLFLFSACEKTSDDDNRKPEEITQAQFDKTEYYPFDVVTVQLPEAAVLEQYDGLVGNQTIVAQRIADSTLVFVAPDLPAGEYTLSLQTGQTKTGGTLNIIALPVVANPEEVIAEVKTSFEGYVASFEQNAPAYAPALAPFVNAFNEHLAKLSADERQQFAAIWQAHPEWHDYSLFDETDLRASAVGRAADLLRLSTKFVVSCTALVFCGDLFIKSVYSLTVAPNLLAGAIAAASAVSAVALLYKAIDLADRAERCAYELKAIVINGETYYSALRTATASDYDYTLNNGETLTFDVQASYHSITAGSAATADGASSAIIETAAKLQSLWDKIASGVNTVRNYVSAVPQLTNRPKTVAELTSPLNVETDAVDDWTLSIVSGNVSAQKSAEKTYTFSTSETEDVEFTFKINASGIESETYSGLLKVENISPVVGTWQHLTSYVEYTRESTGERVKETVDAFEKETYTFTSDNKVLMLYAGDMRSGYYCPFEGYGIESCISLGVLYGYILESATSLVITWYGSNYDKVDMTIKYYCVKISD